ncbi:hypothetical protein DIS24_g9063 [Lasiodiplodia hormozganensis]|uniref:Uncharacterized protein n=1 Tax=Lasiodiplodia hormozganensis TaxID=869390 RepID=A0AA40CM29_9PEZI|nr:hypothetical protein DIS24_g9063 [Lasiodiplodia hormozganensis]
MSSKSVPPAPEANVQHAPRALENVLVQRVMAVLALMPSVNPVEEFYVGALVVPAKAMCHPFNISPRGIPASPLRDYSSPFEQTTHIHLAAAARLPSRTAQVAELRAAAASVFHFRKQVSKDQKR